LARCSEAAACASTPVAGAELGLGLLGLQLQIDFIEGGERLADIDGLAYSTRRFALCPGRESPYRSRSAA